MKKLLLCFCCLPIFASAQNVWFSARLGAAGYHGDLKPSAYLSQLNFFKSFGAQYDLSEHVSARTYLSFTRLHADDKKGDASMKARNLSFQTKLFDWELGAQYNIFNLNERWWTPYVFAGLALYHYDPYTNNGEGKKTYLRPLSTEGQGFEVGVGNYNKTQFGIPVGIGTSYVLGEDMRIGIEGGYRILFTDYLDDVSNAYVDETSLLSARGKEAVNLAWRGGEVSGQPYPAAGTMRGNPNTKDGYYYIAVTFTVRYWF